jgi:hypothetical protein
MQGCLADEIKRKFVRSHYSSIDFTPQSRGKTRLHSKKINNPTIQIKVTNVN